MEEIKIIGKQEHRDNPDLIRITMDIPRVAWLILQQDIKSKSFGTVINVSDAKRTIDTYA